MITVACTAPLGEGGLGRHLAEVVRRLEATPGSTVQVYAPPAVSSRLGSIATRVPPLRFSTPAKTYVDNVCFDRAVAATLRPGTRHLGFAGHSLTTFRRVAAAGATIVLVSPTAHVDHTRSRYREAHSRYPIEEPWLGDRLTDRTRREYELAGTIEVASDYARDSFLSAGVPPERLERVVLTVDDRFRPAPSRTHDDVFRIVYVGALTVAKGVPVLLDAFTRLPVRRAELTLVGGWGTRAMRRYVAEAVARDARITVVTGDPLPHLQRADVFVQPSFQEGFGYAAMEAISCGVPVIVSEDTGMKEHVVEGRNGCVVPTGDVDALVERLVALSDFEVGHAVPIA